MGVLAALAKVGELLPSAPKPARRPDLKRRLFFSFLALAVYFLMASTLVFPLPLMPERPGIQLPTLINVVFASQRGTIAQLGIGPIVTAGLIVQILSGAKIIQLDLTKPEDRRVFTQAVKGLGMLIALVEGLGFAINYRYNPFVTGAIFLQFFFGALILMMLDETIQKGWGIGSGISLFILGGVARTVVWDMFSPVITADINQIYGFVPYVINGVMNGAIEMNRLLFGYVAGLNATLPSLTGFITVIVLVSVLVYLQQMKVNIPVTTQRLPGIKTKVPLQFLYVTNIPILLVGILFSNLLLFNNLASAYLANNAPWLAEAFSTVVYYLAPPRGLLELAFNPVRIAVYSVALLTLAVLFGMMWVEIAGLSPAAQAENLIKSGLQMPGLRRNPRILEAVLAKYIKPLTILSSLIVGSIALIADIFNAYGTGTGLLLATGIIQQIYSQIAYERALEMYPLLKRFIGE